MDHNETDNDFETEDTDTGAAPSLDDVNAGLAEAEERAQRAAEARMAQERELAAKRGEKLRLETEAAAKQQRQLADAYRGGDRSQAAASAAVADVQANATSYADAMEQLRSLGLAR